jgi:hypothetical protein
MHDDKRTQMERTHLEDQEVLTAAEQRLARERLRNAS